MDNTGTILLQVNYKIDEDSRVVSLSHPSLSGALGFEFTTKQLAEVQLQALRTDKTLSPMEAFSNDLKEIRDLSLQLRDSFKSFKTSP